MKTERFPTLAGAPEEEYLMYNIENLGQLKKETIDNSTE